MFDLIKVGLVSEGILTLVVCTAKKRCQIYPLSRKFELHSCLLKRAGNFSAIKEERFGNLFWLREQERHLFHDRK